MFNYNHLYYFHVAATEGSLAAAATKLGLKQPTVSEQLRTLERSLGKPLFERSSSGLRLTSAGQIAFEHTSAMFRSADRLMQALGADRLEPPRSLRVGVSRGVARATSADFLLPLFALDECLPTISSGDALDLVRELRGNELDLVLCETEPTSDMRNGFKHVPIDRVPLVAIIKVNTDPGPQWQNVGLIQYRPTSTYRWDVEAFLDEQNVRPRIVGEIRGRPRTRATPLVFISGMVWTDDVVVDAYRLGAVDFVAKPVQPEVLRAKASLYLRLHETDHAEDHEHKDELIALLGHELRNPLAIMSSALDVVALRDGSLSRELVLVQRQIRHLAHIVDDLVDVSRIRHGTIKLRRGTVHVVSAVADALENVRPLLESRGHNITVTVDPDITITADPQRFEQAVAKVLDNAARYTPAGGRIHVTAQRDADLVRLVIADNGKGIPRELLPRIFDAFVQEPRPIDRGAGGLGLGLTLVRTLVELHGGYVTADSAGAGLGTTLTMHWPILGADVRADSP